MMSSHLLIGLSIVISCVFVFFRIHNDFTSCKYGVRRGEVMILSVYPAILEITVIPSA